ncbi:MAG: hypothetical protein LBU34_00765 [Planctomycetaceae bacterium]|nr:hypothetical protein [Planctomycetaceae bacterium]
MPAIYVKLDKTEGLYGVIIQQIAELRRKSEKTIREIFFISRVMEAFSGEKGIFSGEFEIISPDFFTISLERRVLSPAGRTFFQVKRS